MICRKNEISFWKNMKKSIFRSSFDTLGLNMQATEFIFDFVIKKNANFHGCDFQVHGS